MVNIWPATHSMAECWKRLEGRWGAHRWVTPCIGTSVTRCKRYSQCTQKKHTHTERLDVNAANSAGINVFQLYDATPLKMWFGALQAESASVASYFILSGDRWQRVSFEQYEKKNPRAKVRYGTWELFAQRAQCNCARQSGEHYTIEKQQVACLPVIAEACNASVMWSAMMGACGYRLN